MLHIKEGRKTLQWGFGGEKSVKWYDFGKFPHIHYFKTVSTDNIWKSEGVVSVYNEVRITL
jgi:hypothetical protein